MYCGGIHTIRAEVGELTHMALDGSSSVHQRVKMTLCDVLFVCVCVSEHEEGQGQWTHFAQIRMKICVRIKRQEEWKL